MINMTMNKLMKNAVMAFWNSSVTMLKPLSQKSYFYVVRTKFIVDSNP